MEHRYLTTVASPAGPLHVAVRENGAVVSITFGVINSPDVRGTNQRSRFLTGMERRTCRGRHSPDGRIHRRRATHLRPSARSDWLCLGSERLAGVTDHSLRRNPLVRSDRRSTRRRNQGQSRWLGEQRQPYPGGQSLSPGHRRQRQPDRVRRRDRGQDPTPRTRGRLTSGIRLIALAIYNPLHVAPP